MKKKFRVSSFEFRVINNENRRFFALLSAAFVCIAAQAVTVTYDGRLMDESGSFLPMRNVNATIRAYAAADSADALSAVPITIATDPEGYFSVSTSELWIPPDCSTFWVGVTPDDCGEIAPRMRVSPAPFAIRAAQARALEVNGEFKVEGTAEITTLSGTQNANIRALAATDSLALNCGAQGMGTLYTGKINLGNNGRLSLFRSTSSDWKSLITLKIYAFGTEKSDTNSFVAPDDGIVEIRARVDTSGMSSVSLYMSIRNGDDFTIGDINEALPFSNKENYMYFTFPVRKGSTVTVSAKLTTSSRWYTPDAYIECKCFYAGVE